MARTLDPAALELHVEPLFRRAWALCGNREDAEDLVQDTFAQVLARPRRLSRADDLPYLMGALHNTFVSECRRAARRLPADPIMPASEPADERQQLRPEDAVIAREMLAAIAALPAGQRDAVVAVDVAGLSYAEAGELLGAKEATVTTRLHRARVKLRRAQWVGAGCLLAAALAAGAIAWGGADPQRHDVAAVAALAGRGAEQGPPAEHANGGFPYWEDSVGLEATGSRSDRLGASEAVTVYYRGARGPSLAYAIVGGSSAPAPAGRPLTTPGGVRVALLESGGRRILSWRANGRTCVLSAPASMPLERLLALPET